MVEGLGKRLKKQRELNGLSQREVGEAIGVTQGNINNYERGERTPSLERLVAMAKLFNCSADELLGLKKDDSVGLDVSMLNDDQLRKLQIFLRSMTKDI